MILCFGSYVRHTYCYLDIHMSVYLSTQYREAWNLAQSRPSRAIFKTGNWELGIGNGEWERGMGTGNGEWKWGIGTGNGKGNGEWGMGNVNQGITNR